ncbi:MAG: T9SS type A sorting domain-containing protein [Bacteroidota bacterium]
MIKAFFLFLIVILSTLFCNSQEFLVPLERNSELFLHSDDLNRKSAEIDSDTLILPFFDDFTNSDFFPDNQLWADSFVFINSSFGYRPLSYGVATFDALNQYGEIYEEAEINYYQFSADHLTSLPIRLDSVFVEEDSYLLSPEDSVILSFYYQPQGRGIAPIERDSLVLQFLSVSENEHNKEEEELWISVWSATGENLESFSDNTFPFFKRVMITIEDEQYFRKDFRFRFKNYGSFPADKTPVNYAGNTSIWNIDYVYLNYNRSLADTFYYDIAFVEDARSILKHYTSMPWSHYIIDPQEQLKSDFDVLFANWDNITYNYSYRYYITDAEDNLLRNYSGGTWNIAPFSESGYQDYQPHTNPEVIANPLPTAPADNNTFYIYHVIREGSEGDSFQRNDTIKYEQIFDDYYAYDDGIPEAGYGLTGWNPQGACRFVAAKSDYLESVRFFFNRTKADDNVNPFNLTIWKSLDPEEILYQSEVLMPEFDEDIFSFVEYPLSEAVLVTDTFYVGWSQMTDDFINIGYDVNNDAGSNIFFNTEGYWQQSMFSGALLIRPVFNYSTSVDVIENPNHNIRIYPSPATSNFIYLDSGVDVPESAIIQIFNLQGAIILQDSYKEQININSLPSGTYILRVVSSELDLPAVRFIVMRK